MCPRYYVTYSEKSGGKALIAKIGVMKDDTFVTYTQYIQTFIKLFPAIDYHKLENTSITCKVLDEINFKISFKTSQYYH